MWGNYRVWTKCETGKCPSLMSPWLCRQPSYPTMTHVVKAWRDSYIIFFSSISLDFRARTGKWKKSNYREKIKNNNKKNRTVKKNQLKFWKNRPVRFGFGFISLKPKKPNQTQTGKKTEPNRKKTSQIEKPSKTEKIEPNRVKTKSNRKNQAKPIWTGFCLKKPNRTETGRFEPVSVLKKNSVWLLFFNKNQIEPKIFTSNLNHIIFLFHKPMRPYLGGTNFVVLGSN